MAGELDEATGFVQGYYPFGEDPVSGMPYSTLAAMRDYQPVSGREDRRAMRNRFPRARARQDFPWWQRAIGYTPGVSPGGGGGDAFMDSLMLGTSDEAGAAAKTALGRLIAMVQGRTPVRDFSSEYEGNLAIARDDLDQSYSDNPIGSIAAGFVGGIPWALVPGLSGGQALSRLQRYLRAGAAGAGFGGVYGFNTGQEDLTDRGINAAIGGTLGAITGAGIPYLADRVPHVGEVIPPRVRTPAREPGRLPSYPTIDAEPYQVQVVMP